MVEHIRRNSGVCSMATRVVLNDDASIQEVQVVGGCAGNLAGICSLLKGMKAQDAIERMKGTRCGGKPTSCPDQISQALEEALVKQAQAE